MSLCMGCGRPLGDDTPGRSLIKAYERRISTLEERIAFLEKVAEEMRELTKMEYEPPREMKGAMGDETVYVAPERIRWCLTGENDFSSFQNAALYLRTQGGKS